jgi:hypothetical protein
VWRVDASLARARLEGNAHSDILFLQNLSLSRMRLARLVRQEQHEYDRAQEPSADDFSLLITLLLTLLLALYLIEKMSAPATPDHMQQTIP